MVPNYIEQIKTYFKNIVLNAMGTERDIYQLLEDGDVDRVISMMQERDSDVDNAIREYNPQTHKIMKRPNKARKGQDPYVTCKLARSRQRYINEVELFFLLGKNIEWAKDDGDDEAYELYTNFLNDYHFDATIRKAKRLAGSETEAAKLYHIYRNEERHEAEVRSVVLARSTGYKLRPMFDQYGQLTAFAYGYKLKENGKSVEHWDIQTPKMLFYCKRAQVGWQVESLPNPTGKINVLYYQQPKAWDGVEPRLEREEEMESKIGDTNNYFADPIALATADVVQSMKKPDTVGSLLQLTGKESDFRYVNPPQASELRRDEATNLEKSILFDTFTPDFSWENMKGMGTLSGAALKNAMILGFIKADNRKEIYGEMIEREKNVIIAILKYLHPEMAKKLDELKIRFHFACPFDEDKHNHWTTIGTLYNQEVISLELAVKLLALADAPEEEVEKIKQGIQEKAEMQAGAAANPEELQGQVQEGGGVKIRPEDQPNNRVI